VHHWLVREAAVLVATDRDHASNSIVLRYDQVALFRREYWSSREETFVSEASKPLRSGRYRPKECGAHCQAFRLAQPRLDSNPPLTYSFLTERQAARLTSNLAASPSLKLIQFGRPARPGWRSSRRDRQGGARICPTEFFYFPTREALVMAVLEVARFLTEMAARIHSGGGAARRIVLAHAKAFADSVETHTDYARVCWI
jgi:hypothetical protein